MLLCSVDLIWEFSKHKAAFKKSGRNLLNFCNVEAIWEVPVLQLPIYLWMPGHFTRERGIVEQEETLRSLHWVIISRKLGLG